MAPEPNRIPAARRLSALAAVLTLLALLALAAPAQAFRIVNYNITNYPGGAARLASRQPSFRTIMAPLGADVVVTQEMQSQAGVDSFLTNVLNVNEPGQWAASPFVNGNDTDNELFYRPSRVTLVGMWTFYPNPPTQLRLVNVYRLQLVDQPATEFRIYSQHLKASQGFETQRLGEAVSIRDSMNVCPSGTYAILTGDFNIYTSTEPAFQKFFELQVNNIGRLYDPLSAVGTFNNAGFAPIHTQCPCLTCPASSGFSGGGLDDRFDMFLPTLNMANGQGLDLLTSTYKPVGNDGLHYNLNITDAPTIPEGAAYANALWNASDHLPIRVDLQLPARSSGPASLAFGTVIVGATASQTLELANANAPLDQLDGLTYQLAAPAGFTAPAGTLTIGEGATGSDAIAMDTSTPGIKAGTLVVTSDDPANLVRNIGLSGTVLRHASSSLDSGSVQTAGAIDFGTHDAGQFAAQDVRVHNQGYDASQARLNLTGASITGGDGHFSVTGTTPQLLSGVGASFSVAFDDAATTADSTYTATLTFTSGDEPLPGAAAATPLGVTLSARRGAGTTGVDDQRPSATVLLAPVPNPLMRSSLLRFALASGGETRLDIYDTAGRRVASLIHDTLEPGNYSVSWDGRADGGEPLGAGLYFARLIAPGVHPHAARLAIVR
jgi:endonuclease/exonuclease/phosphatase family metal-dependent hydrolase